MGTNIPRRKSWSNQYLIPGAVYNESFSSLHTIPPPSVYNFPQGKWK